MSVRKIVTYPNPVLAKPASEVNFPLSNEDKQLIKDMWDTVYDIGVGLAAPQVGVSKKICIISLTPDMLPKKQKIRSKFTMINPTISQYSDTETAMIEGCLSFPDEFWDITRPSSIIAHYYDEKGKKQAIKASGWLSRVIQHEVDHLNGDLFINKGGIKIKEEDLDKSRFVD